MADNAVDKAARDDANSPDHLPACPRCADLLAPGSLVCVECGCRVTVNA